MLDCHIHLETGPYTLAWVKKYVGYALQRGLSEIQPAGAQLPLPRIFTHVQAGLHAK